jgi:hypothetical protein
MGKAFRVGDRVMKNNDTMVNWISTDEWGQYYDKNYSAYCRSKQIDFSEKDIVVDISLVELQSIISVPPVSNPIDMDEPGPCERWYCCIDELLFWVTYYHTPSEKYTIITCVAPLFQGKYRWSFLEKLIDLPSPILRRISWIRGHNDAEKSVYITEINGLSCELYRAKTYVEATELMNFLPAFKSEYKYYIDEPKDFQ